jgi:hypothetical protein
MKRKLAIVILLAVLALLSIPTVAVFLVKTTSIQSLAALPCDNGAIHAPQAPKESERRVEHDTGPETDTEGSGRVHMRRRRRSPRRSEVPQRPIMTRGGPCEYRHIGILTVDGTEGPVSLFGRPTYRGSDRWNYYALSNQHVPQKLPVFCSSGASGPVGPMDCAKLKGCPEASDGDTLDVRGYGRASVTLYTRDEYF